MASPLDALAAELGAEFARLEHELRLQYELGQAQMRECLERLGRQTAELTTRAITLEHELREQARDRLAAIPDLATLVREECDRREESIVQRAAGLVPSVEVPDFGALVTGEVERQAPAIAVRAAELVPPAEPPDVAAAVSDELDRRQDGLLSRVLALVPPPEPPDLAGAVTAEIDRVLQDVATHAAELVPPVEVPDVAPIVEAAVAAEFARREPEAVAALASLVDAAVPAAVDAELERRQDDIVSRAAGMINPAPGMDDIEKSVAAEVTRQVPEIAVRAAELVPPVEVPDVAPIVEAAVDAAVGPTIEGQLHEIARQASELVVLPEMPDVSGAVSAEFSRRQDDIVDTAAALAVTRMLEQVDVNAAIDTALEQRLPGFAQEAAARVVTPELPDVASLVGAEIDKRQDEVVSRAAVLAAGPSLEEIAAQIDEGIDRVMPAIVERAAAAVPPADTPDVERAVSEEVGRVFNIIVTQAAALVPPPPDADAVRVFVTEQLDARLAEVVRQAAALVPPVEVPDVAALVVDEIGRREEDLVQRAAALVPPPPDAAAVTLAVSVEIEQQLPEIAKLAAELVPPAEVPDYGRLVVDEFDRRHDDLVQSAAASVRVPELPDIGAMVDNAVAGAFACVRVPQDGKPPDPEMLAAMVRVQVGKAFAEMMPAPTDEEVRAQQDALVHDITQRLLVLLPPPEKGESVTLEQLRPMVEGEIARQLAAVPPADTVAIALGVTAAVIGDLDSRVPEIAQKAAELVPPAEPPDVAAAVSDEFSRREDRIVDSVTHAVLERLPEPPTLPDIPAMIEGSVADAVAQLPPAEKGDTGPPGFLPMVSEWTDRVHYQTEVVVHDGRLYQATRDTGRPPPHDDWLCICYAPAGAAGRSLRIRETWSPNAEYRALDVVGLNGCAFVARVDDPGVCPGAGWQLLSDRGRAGKPLRGDPGPPGPGVLDVRINDEEVLILTNSDGSTVRCDLYPTLRKLER